MSDASDAGATPQAGDAGNGDGAADAAASAGSGQPQAGDSGSTTSAGDQESPDARIARLEAELAETRREAASRRRAQREAEQRAADLEQAGMSETQRAEQRAAAAEARAAELEASIRTTTARSAVIDAAVAAGAVAPADVWALVRDDALADDADVPAIVKAALDARPYLTKPAPPDSGATANGARSAESAKTGPTDAEMRRDLGWGTGSDIFNAEENARRGGGVVTPDPSKLVRNG